MSKTIVPLRAADGSSKSVVFETLPGGVAQVLHVVTAIPTVVSFQQVTIGTSAVTLASLLTGAAIPTGATHALVKADSTNTGIIRMTDDGTVNPTSTIGLELAAGEPAEWTNLAAIKVIATAAGQKLNLSFRRYDQ